MERVKKVFTVTLTVLLICMLLFSAAVTAIEAGHDCSGADCPVCAALQALTAVIHCLTVIAAVTLSAAVFVNRNTADRNARRFWRTPVTEKVRLLN